MCECVYVCMHRSIFRVRVYVHVCLYMCKTIVSVCALVHTHAHTHVFMCNRPTVKSNVSLYDSQPYILWSFLSFEPDWLARKDPGILLPPSSRSGITGLSLWNPAFYVDIGNPDSGPHSLQQTLCPLSYLSSSSRKHILSHSPPLS